MVPPKVKKKTSRREYPSLQEALKELGEEKVLEKINNQLFLRSLILSHAARVCGPLRDPTLGIEVQLDTLDFLPLERKEDFREGQEVVLTAVSPRHPHLHPGSLGRIVRIDHERSLAAVRFLEGPGGWWDLVSVGLLRSLPEGFTVRQTSQERASVKRVAGVCQSLPGLSTHKVWVSSTPNVRSEFYSDGEGI
jgi:hypothetical protein